MTILSSPVHHSKAFSPISVIPSGKITDFSVLLGGFILGPIYGMFIAIIVPPMKEDKSIIIAVIGAVLLSCGFYFLPYLILSA